MSHTPEPWPAPHPRGFRDPEPILSELDLGILSEADYARARACVNACAGLTQDHFDGGWTAAGLSAHAKRVEDQRDALAAAVRALLECEWNFMTDTNGISIDATVNIRNSLRAALESMK